MITRSLVALTLGVTGTVALASSHREAPSISRDPAVDLTDVYTFRSTQTGHQVFVMNVSPAYQSYAGPNWYGFDDEAIYEMHIDNNGDAVEDVTYQFKFTTRDYRDPKTGLIVSYFPNVTFENGAYSGLLAPGALNQTYAVKKIAGPRRASAGSDVVTGALVAPPRIGPHTTDGPAKVDPNAPESLGDMYAAYKALANNAIKTVGTSKFFAGPRNDPFYVDLGAVFDRVSPRIAGVTGNPRDALKGGNVLSIVFEVPDSEVFGDTDFIGVWATTSRPQAKVLNVDGKASKVGGGYVQVSRLGNPLVNEVVIKMQDKDKFNFTEPKDDVKNYAGYVIQPQLAFVLNVLYNNGGDGRIPGVTKGLTADGLITKVKEGSDKVDANARGDLVDAFVTGIKGVSRHPNAGGVADDGAIKAFTGSGDMIRVNRNLNLGAPVEGWPLNGRKLGDDVVATALQFLANCKVLTQYGDFDISSLWPGFHDVAKPTSGIVPANCLLDDFVTRGDATPGSGSNNGIIAEFPYIDLPHSSYYSRTDFPTYTYP